MRHFANPKFWEAYRRLPEQVRALADKNYALLKENPQHPSLQFKKWGDQHGQPGYLWFWIGDHDTYDSLVS